MGKKSLEPITESMFYVLLCLHNKNMYGTEMAELVRKITDDRVKLGPGTLYSILSTFETEGVISKFSQEGRKLHVIADVPGIKDVSLFDMQGHLLYAEQFSGSAATLDLAGISRSTFVIRLTAGNKTLAVKRLQ